MAVGQGQSCGLVELGKLIAQALHEADLSEAELARQIAVTKGTLSRWVRGLNRPRDKAFQRFFDVVEPALDVMTRRDLLAAVGALEITLVTSPWRPRWVRRAPRLSRHREDRDPGNLPESSSHEERAENLNRSEAWVEAQVQWHLEARDAQRKQDWPRAVRCDIAIGQMAINLGKPLLAERHFRSVLKRPEHQLTPQAKAEASIRLGWLYADNERWRETKSVLEGGIRLARRAKGATRQEFRILDNGTTIRCDGHDAMVILESIALLFLGRTNIAQGEVEKGLEQLEASCQHARTRQEPWSLGCRLVAKIPGLVLSVSDEGQSIPDVLDESRGALTVGASGEGFLHLGEARWQMAEDPHKGMNALDAAEEGFTQRTFYARGVADVLSYKSGLYLANASLLPQGSHRQALDYALTAVALSPHGSKLSALEEAVGITYADVGFDSGKFWGLWHQREEDIWAMSEPPFGLLNKFLERLGAEDACAHIEGSLHTARNLARRIVAC